MPHKDKIKRAAYNRDYDHAHREDKNARARAHYATNREERKASRRANYQLNAETQKASQRAYWGTLKADALRILGSRCACPGCDVSEPAFLTIDHINGRPKGSRKKPVREARASGWDKNQFQILCFNCNGAKKDRGFCPVHQTAPSSNGHRPGPQGTLWDG